MDDNGIAARIREIRESNDLSQQAIAEILYISQSAYSRRETGLTEFSAGEVKAIAQFTKADIRKIFE